jgi:hypothetical protein
MHVTLSNMYNVLYVLSVSSRGFSLFCKIGHLQFQLLWGWCHLVSFLETLPVKNVTFFSSCLPCAQCYKIYVCLTNSQEK